MPQSPNEDKEVQFVSFVLDDAQGFWKQQFQAAGKPYQRAKLVLFRDQVNSGCGAGQLGYRPVLLPARPEGLHRPRVLRRAQPALQGPRRLRPGVRPRPRDRPSRPAAARDRGEGPEESQQNPDEANDLSVRLELQADCFAGVWGRSTYDRGILENGDLQEGLNAAAAVGDDRIQQQAKGRIDPETFTHGTSEQRAHWLQTGFDSGKLESCDTFSGEI